MIVQILDGRYTRVLGWMCEWLSEELAKTDLLSLIVCVMLEVGIVRLPRTAFFSPLKKLAC